MMLAPPKGNAAPKDKQERKRNCCPSKQSPLPHEQVIKATKGG